MRALLVITLLSALSAFAANTTVTDIVYDSGLNPVRGKLYVTPSQQWTCVGGQPVYPREREITISPAGVFTVALCPTDTATPSGVYYAVRFVLANSRTVSEVWTVPTSGSPVGLSVVRTTPAPTPSTGFETFSFLTKKAESALTGEFSLGALADNAIITCDVSLSICTPRAALYTDVVALWTSCGSNFMKGDGTCTTAGSGAFSSLTGGTNTAAAMVVGAGATLAPTSATAGQISANYLNGTQLSSMTTGLLHVTTTSGAVVGGLLVNADVNASAAIAASKLAAMTVSRAVVSDSSGFIAPATTTAAEIGFVNGVTSAIQTQLDAKATLASTNTFTGRQAAGGAASTQPMKVGTSLPGTCIVGDLFFKSDATAGQNIYQCPVANTWTQQLNSGGSAGASLGALGTITSAPTLDGGSGTVKTITATLGANITCGTLQNFTAGQIITLKLTQDGTGSRTFACSGITDLGTVSGVIGKVDIQVFYAPTTSTLQAMGPMWCSTCDPGIYLPGSTSGASTIAAPATGGGATVLPTGAGTLLYANGSAAALTGLLSSQIPKVPLTAGTSVTLTENNRFFVCTSTCTITVPVPSAGVQYCVRNSDNVSTVITFAAIGSGAMYENTANTAYGTAGTGTLIAGGATGDKICIVGFDSTHYQTWSYAGTWTVN